MELLQFDTGRPGVAGEDIKLPKVFNATEFVAKEVAAGLTRWQERYAVRFSERELEILQTSLIAGVLRLQPKTASADCPQRAFFLPSYRPGEPPGCYLAINTGSRLALYQSNHQFHELSTHSLDAWSRKVAGGFFEGATSPKHLSGFWPVEFPADWSTTDSRIATSWCQVLATSIRFKAEANKIKAFSKRESALTLAPEMLPAVRPAFTWALEFLVHGEDRDWRPRTAGHVAPQNPLEHALFLPQAEKRVAMVQWLFSAPCFASSRAAGDRVVHRALSRAVAERQPFVKEASRLFDCPPPLISRLRKGSLEAVRKALHARLLSDDKHRLEQTGLSSHVVVRFLSKVPLSKVPEFDDSFIRSKDFKGLSRVLVASLQLAFADGGARNGDAQKQGLEPAGRLLALESLGAGTRGQWVTQAAAVNDQHWEKVMHASDMINAVARCTILPQAILDRMHEATYTGDLEPRILLKLARSLTLAAIGRETGVAGIMKISEHWHRVGLNNERSVSAGRSWSAILPAQAAPNGCRLIPLTCDAALSEEGGAMRHCVGGYSTYCLLGDSQIFSIRSAAGERLSTLELRIDRKQSPPAVSIRQNRARFNLQPAPEADEAAAWLKDGINSGAVKVDWTELGKTALRTQATELCGFDPRDAEAWEKEYAGIRPFLPARLAAAKPGEFLARCDFAALTQQLLRIRETLREDAANV